MGYVATTVAWDHPLALAARTDILEHSGSQQEQAPPAEEVAAFEPFEAVTAWEDTDKVACVDFESSQQPSCLVGPDWKATKAALAS